MFGCERFRASRFASWRAASPVGYAISMSPLTKAMSPLKKAIRSPDRGRILRARVVVGHDQQVCPACGELAHHRALAAVAIAAAPEHDEQPATGERSQRSQRAGDGGRFVAVVDDGEERLAGVDSLHPAGHGRDGHRRRGDLSGDAVLMQDRQGQQRVGNVVPARHGTGRVDRAVRTMHPEDSAAVRALNDVGRMPRCLLVATGVDRDVRAGEVGHPPSPAVVGDDDRGRGAVEQRRLRAEVLLHVRVEVEMVLGQVRERADRELDPPDPSHRQRVAGHLHRDVRRAALAHHREQCLGFRCFRGGEARLDRVVADQGGHRSDQAAHPSRGLQTRAHEEGRRGLPARAGHAEDVYFAARVAVDARGHRSDRGADVGDGQHRHAVGYECRAGRVGEDGDGTGSDRLLGIARPVGRLPRGAGKQVTGPHQRARHGHAGHREIAADHPRARPGDASQRTERARNDPGRSRDSDRSCDRGILGRHVSRRYLVMPSGLPRRRPVAARASRSNRSAGCARGRVRSWRSRGTAVPRRRRPRARVRGCRP